MVIFLRGSGLDTELLKTFLEIRTTRHFGRAAENLYITQAAVSARIKQLEESLGVSLFIRSRNNIQLSCEGERLVPHAEAMLMALARARQDVVVDSAGSRQIQLGVRVGIWSKVLFQRLQDLRGKRPELRLQVESHEPAHLIRMLLDRTLDIAILYEAPQLPELHSSSIGELSLKLYSSGARQTQETALANNYVYLDWGGGFARFHSRQFGEGLTPVLRTNMNELARDHLTHSGGACYLPASQEGYLAEVGLTPVAEAPTFVRQLNVVYHSATAQGTVIETVIKAFTAVAV